MKTAARNPKAKKLLLFDLDGTLFDSREFLVHASFETLETYFPGMFSQKQIQDSFGNGFHKLLPVEDLERNERALQEFAQKKYRAYHMHSELFPGVNEGLHRLKEDGFRLGVVTNQMKQVSLNAIEHHGLTELFDIVIGLEDVNEGKPSPEGIEKAIAHLNVTREETAMIGDSKADLLAANNACVESYLLLWYEESKAATSLNPNFICADFDELYHQINKGLG